MQASQKAGGCTAELLELTWLFQVNVHLSVGSIYCDLTTSVACRHPCKTS